MKVSPNLLADEAIALRRFMKEHSIDKPEIAIRIAVREYLIACGYLELEYELDEDTETAGEA